MSYTCVKYLIRKLEEDREYTGSFFEREKIDAALEELRAYLKEIE